jgi:hypothetical protein
MAHPAAPKITSLNPADPMFEGLSVRDYDELYWQAQMITEYMAALNPMDTVEQRIEWFLDLCNFCYTNELCLIRMPSLRSAIMSRFQNFLGLAASGAVQINLDLRDQLNRMFGMMVANNTHLTHHPLWLS